MEAKNNENIEADVVVKENKVKEFLKKHSKQIFIGLGTVGTIAIGVVAAMVLSGGNADPDAVADALDGVDVDFKEVDIDGDKVEVGTF